MSLSHVLNCCLSSRFIETLFGHALRDPTSKFSLIHSLTVCIPLLEQKRAATYSSSLMTSRRRHISGGPNPAIREIICVMLPKLGLYVNSLLWQLLHGELVIPPAECSTFLHSRSLMSNSHFGNYLNFFLISGDLRRLLDASGNKENLPTTYGELKPPLGKHRLKVTG